VRRDPAATSVTQFYQRKRDLFLSLIEGSRFRPLRSSGTFFQLADYSAIRDTDDLNFCEWLVREAGVAAIPVSAFYETAPDAKLVRFCFAKNDETLVAAAERLCKL
jgi:methionine aminotransferase